MTDYVVYMDEDGIHPNTEEMEIGKCYPVVHNGKECRIQKSQDGSIDLYEPRAGLLDELKDRMGL